MTKTDWNPLMVATFRALHRADGSFAEIAAQMSAIFGLPITRNACIGKARRLELPMRSNDRPRVPLPVKAGKTIAKPIRVDAPIPPPGPTAPSAPGVDIYQLGSGVCRWPLGEVTDRPPYRYCGGHAPIEAPYCAKHRRAAYTTSRPFQVAV